MTFSFGMVGSAVHTFAAPPAVAQFISPVIGSATLGLTQPFQWTTSPVAAAYYLSVGSSAGNGDVFVILVPASQSSLVIPPLPLGKTLWARIWTEVAGAGWYAGTDVSFTVQEVGFMNPVVGSRNIAMTHSFQWSTAPAASTYYLSVGSSAGNGDVFTTFVPASQSSWVIPPLPHGQVLWARIWTEIPDYGWYHGQDVSFTIA